jgi:hypothetical protein
MLVNNYEEILQHGIEYNIAIRIDNALMQSPFFALQL